MENNKEKNMYTVIVGAGVTGLTAAAILAENGEKCLLLESKDKVGGLCSTYDLDGVTFDLGPHLLFMNEDFEPDRFIMDLLKNEQVVSNRFCFAIHGQGRFWKMPLNIPDILFFYPWKYKREMIKAHLNKGNGIQAVKDSVQSMLEEKTGHSYYVDLYGPLMFKKTGVAGDKLHRDWPLRVDRDIENKKVVFSGVEFSKGPLQKIKDILNPRYYYPLEGFEIIARKLLERYSRAGGETILKCGEIGLNKENNRIANISVDGKTFPVKNIIWTPSVNKLNRILEADAAPIHYVDLLIVLATYKRTQKVPRPFAYTYHIDDKLSFNRLYYPDNIYKDRSLPDREGICAEISSTAGLEKASDKEVIDRVLNDIESAGLYKKNEVRQHQLFRLKNAMPVYELDYESKLEDIYKTIHSFENLYSIGRLGGYFFCQTPGAVMQGIKIAKHLTGNAEIV